MHVSFSMSAQVVKKHLSLWLVIVVFTARSDRCHVHPFNKTEKAGIIAAKK